MPLLMFGNQGQYSSNSASNASIFCQAIVSTRKAKEGNFMDKKCPFSGNVSIRGKILKGMCISTKMKRTIIIRRNYLHYIKKYNRFEKRHKNVAVHCSPCFSDVKEGDIVTAGQRRPLAKTVRFNVVKVKSHQIFGTARKQFWLF